MTPTKTARVLAHSVVAYYESVDPLEPLGVDRIPSLLRCCYQLAVAVEQLACALELERGPEREG